MLEYLSSKTITSIVQRQPFFLEKQKQIVFSLQMCQIEFLYIVFRSIRDDLIDIGLSELPMKNSTLRPMLRAHGLNTKSGDLYDMTLGLSKKRSDAL